MTAASPDSPPQAQPRPRTPRASRWGLSIAAGLFLGAAVLALMPPRERATLPADPVARGEAFEQALAAALTKVRPAGEEWAIAIDPADVNAWLETRLPKWIEHDPSLGDWKGATTLRIASVDGALQLEETVGRGWIRLTLPIEPAINASRDSSRDSSPGSSPGSSAGSRRLRVGFGTARVGRLPVPGLGAAIAQSVESGLGSLGLASRAPEIQLSDGRTVEVHEISCEPGRVALRFATRAPAREGG